MANNKILKWLVGLSGVTLFTGFVGLTQHNDQQNPAISQINQQSANSPTQTDLQGSIRDQWINSSPAPNSGDGSSGNTGTLPSGSDNNFIGGASSGTTTLPGTGKVRGGKVRSHAS